MSDALDAHDDLDTQRRGGDGWWSRFRVLDTAGKAKLMRAMNERTQFAGSFMGGMGRRALMLRVRRDALVEDTLNVLQQCSSYHLKLPLKVEFKGEQGIDQGGVSKEFFQLVTGELLDPKYGMFVYYDHDGNEVTPSDDYGSSSSSGSASASDSRAPATAAATSTGAATNGRTAARVCWINPNTFDSRSTFELIGILIGLAIHNNIILPLSFPTVLYVTTKLSS